MLCIVVKKMVKEEKHSTHTRIYDKRSLSLWLLNSFSSLLLFRLSSRNCAVEVQFQVIKFSIIFSHYRETWKLYATEIRV